MKQNYWSEAKWCLQGRRRFLSSVRFESELGKILLEKSAQVSADLRARELTYRQCRFWFRVLSAGRSYLASEIKIIKHLLPAEVYLHERRFCFGVWWKCALLPVFLGCNRWFSYSANIPLAKQYLNWPKRKPPLVLIILSIFLLSVEIQVQKSFWSICYNTSSQKG